jgi:mercuric ion transport protein
MKTPEPTETQTDKTSVLLKFGLIGTVILALCCFTPVLVILLGVVGMSAALGWIDYVLLPALAVFIGITVYALWHRRTRKENP